MAIDSKTIASIFLNFLFAAGVILAVIGFIQSLQFGAYTLFLDEYPLRSYEDNCDHLSPTAARLVPNESPPQPTQAELDQRKTQCQARLKSRRQIKRLEDSTRAAGFLIAGFTLILAFNPKSKFASNLT